MGKVSHKMGRVMKRLSIYSQWVLRTYPSKFVERATFSSTQAYDAREEELSCQDSGSSVCLAGLLAEGMAGGQIEVVFGL